MEFRLIYRGGLRAQNSATITDKQAIRREIHQQLGLLWKQQPLSEMHERINPATEGNINDVNLLRKVGSFQFVPLVSSTYGWNTIAELDILFMRPSEPGSLIGHGGDLDNRLKTLFDALRMPKAEEIPAGDRPSADEKPFFVLLEDDALITSFNVVTDRLLTPTAIGTNLVELIINVRIKTTRSSMANIGV